MMIHTLLHACYTSLCMYGNNVYVLYTHTILSTQTVCNCTRPLYRFLFVVHTIDQYMAFGISGSTTSTNMVGADVVVTWINDDGPNAIDYYLTSRQQVSIHL